MSQESLVDLIDELITHMAGAPDEWTSFSMVIGLAGGRLSGTSGCAYSADGTWTPVASRPSGITSALDAFLAERYGANPVLPAQLLIQYDRERRLYEVTFEDSDPLRWKVTPDNFEEMPELLRPRFAS